MTTPLASSRPLLTSQQTVRLFLIGLPTGLIVTGIIAMFIYFRIDATRQERDRPRITARPPTESELRSQVRTLAAGIGSRHAGAPETLVSAAKFIQSTLGPANLGFQVSRHEFDVDGVTRYNLVIDLPGTAAPEKQEIVLVTANYDSAAESPGADSNATGVAALMSLAQSMAGSKHFRTLRLAALVNETPPWAGTASSGSAAYVESLRSRQDRIAVVVCLDGLGYYSDSPASQLSPSAAGVVLPDRGDFLLLAANQEAARFLPRLTAEFVTGGRLPLQVPGPGAFAALSAGAAATFSGAGWPVLAFSDTGVLRNKEFGKAGDVPERIDYVRLLEAVRGIEAALRSLLTPSAVKP